MASFEAGHCSPNHHHHHCCNQTNSGPTRCSLPPFANSLTPLQSDKNQDREVGGCAFTWKKPHCRAHPSASASPNRERESTKHGKVPVIRPSEEAQTCALCDKFRERFGLPAQPVGWLFRRQPGHHAQHPSALTSRALSVSFGSTMARARWPPPGA